MKGAEFGVHLRLVGMALLWGASWPAGRTLALAMPPLSGSAWRISLAAALMLAWVGWTRRAWPSLSGRQWLGLAMAGAIGVAGYAIFFMLALQRVEASRAAIVVTTNPVFVTLLAAWLFKEKFNVRIALGLACAVIGAATVLTQGAPWKLLVGDVGLGEWLLLSCIATWVGYTLLWGATLAIEGPALAWRNLAELTAPGWASLVFLAVGATVLAYAWYFRGVGALGAGTAASYISLVPVFGVASSAFVLGERIDASLLVGGALAVLGVVITNRARR